MSRAKRIKRISYKGYEISWNPYFKKWAVPMYCGLFGTVDMAKEAIDAYKAEQEELGERYTLDDLGGNWW